MALAADEERALSQIEEELRRCDPKLAAKLAMFNRLTRTEAMPQRELLTTPGRLRRLRTRAGLAADRWRLYPPIPSRGAHLGPPPGPAARSGLGARPQSGRHFNLSPRPSRLPGVSQHGVSQHGVSQHSVGRPGVSPRRGGAQHGWPSRFVALLPVIVTVCALGAIVAIFSALSRVDTTASNPAPASTCHTVLLSGCQPSAGHGIPRR